MYTKAKAPKDEDRDSDRQDGDEEGAGRSSYWSVHIIWTKGVGKYFYILFLELLGLHFMKYTDLSTFPSCPVWADAANLGKTIYFCC